jgi:hypothetical protein
MKKLNENLIKKVLEHIRRFPESYDQNDVARSCDVTKKTPCGAIGCFGGWTVLIGIPKSKRQHKAFLIDNGNGLALNKARDLLGLTDCEADFLFDMGSGNARQDYQLIQRRLKHIREARKAIHYLKSKSMSGDVGFATVDGYGLEYHF